MNVAFKHLVSSILNKRILTRSLIYGLILGILAAVVLWFLSNIFATMASQVPPASRPSLSQEFLPFPATKEVTPSFDGLPISFWYAPQSDDPKKPTLVIIHGFGASKEHMLTYMLFAQKHGYSLAALDLRGHGDSGTSLCSFGYREKQDVLAVMTWLEGKGKSRFVLWGTSMGAVTSVLTAQTQPPHLAGIILDAPFDTLRNTLTHHAKVFFNLSHFPLMPIICWRIQQLVGYDVDEIDVSRALQATKVPVLFMAAENDVRMPVPLVRGLYEAAHEPKTFYIIPSCGHEYRNFDPGFQTTVLTFLKSIK